jgi:hypothetical protein
MMIPGLELRFISSAIGQGVVTTRPIPRGTIVWVLDPLDRRVSETEYLALPALLRAELDRYGYVDTGGDRILCWDLGRYMNHSCAPTGRNAGGLIEVAIRDIAADEELTTDYAALKLGLPIPCACGSNQCRGTIELGRAELAAHSQAWDVEAAEALALAAKVDQPLAPLLGLHPTLRELWNSLRLGQRRPDDLDVSR